MDSIIQKTKECLVCRTTIGLESHHIYPGPRRHISEEYGLKVWLCHDHHTGVNGVHSSKGSQLMQELKKLGQTVFTEKYGDELFFQRFGKNYLKGDTDEDE